MHLANTETTEWGNGYCNIGKEASDAEFLPHWYTGDTYQRTRPITTVHYLS
jgi:hypothetical protein